MARAIALRDDFDAAALRQVVFLEDPLCEINQSPASTLFWVCLQCLQLCIG